MLNRCEQSATGNGHPGTGSELGSNKRFCRGGGALGRALEPECLQLKWMSGLGVRVRVTSCLFPAQHGVHRNASWSWCLAVTGGYRYEPLHQAGSRDRKSLPSRVHTPKWSICPRNTEEWMRLRPGRKERWYLQPGGGKVQRWHIIRIPAC